MPYRERERAWGEAKPVPASDTLVVKATNLASATVDARRAKLSCAPTLDVTSDGPLDLTIACPKVKAARCSARVRLKLPRLKGRRILSATALRGHRRLRTRRGLNLRVITVRRPTRNAFTLRLRLQTTKHGTVTVTRRVPRCT